ncbi:MAG TPA: pilus assembly protein TadG-related protein [Chloroflexota bacterium]|nr:pilus assembly protein TadG-related protein [Chloroflexota bacterium]
MCKEEGGEGRRSRRHARAPQGSALVLGALLMVVLIGMVGLAIDLGYIVDRYLGAQNNADAAALAGADSVINNANSSASSMDAAVSTAVAQVMQTNGAGSQAVSLKYLDTNKNILTTAQITSPVQIKYVQANVTDTFNTFFGRVLGRSNAASVSSKAVARVQWQSQCELCVLDSSASGALSVSGGGGFSGNNIRVVVDSSDNSAMTVGGSSAFTDTGTDAAIDLVGGYSLSGGGSIIPSSPVTGISPIPDPLAWVSVPISVPMGDCTLATWSGGGGKPCDHTPPDVSPNNSQTVTIYPGVYHNITDNSSGILTLKPGVYVVTGKFTDQAQSRIVGNGVMLYITCASNQSPYYMPCTSNTNSSSMGQVGLSGASTVILSAPTALQATCPISQVNDVCPVPQAYQTSPRSYVPSVYTGILIFQDRLDNQTVQLSGTSSSAPPATCSDSATSSCCTSVSTASGNSCVSGTIYVKDAPLQITGGGAAQTPMQTYIIADTVSFSGNGGNGSSPQSFAMSFPQGVNAPLAATNGLVE